jgi:hypothetical protein
MGAAYYGVRGGRKARAVLGFAALTPTFYELKEVKPVLESRLAGSMVGFLWDRHT